MLHCETRTFVTNATLLNKNGVCYSWLYVLPFETKTFHKKHHDFCYLTKQERLWLVLPYETITFMTYATLRNMDLHDLYYFIKQEWRMLLCKTRFLMTYGAILQTYETRTFMNFANLRNKNFHEFCYLRKPDSSWPVLL